MPTKDQPYRNASINTPSYKEFETFLKEEYNPTENLNLSMGAVLTKAMHDFMKRWREEQEEEE